MGQENFLFKRYYQDYAQIYTKMGFYQVRKPETYSELCQTFKTKLFFATIVNGWHIFVKSLILDIYWVLNTAVFPGICVADKTLFTQSYALLTF